MTTQTPSLTLAEAIFPQTGLALRVKQLVLVAAGIAALVLAAKIKIPMFPVPMTMGTFVVLSIGAAYGARLGLATILGYMLIGAMGFDVFAGSSAEVSGFGYMMGSTGGYLVGYVLAVVALGALARKGWDRARGKMALALVLGNTLIYVPGLVWLTVLYGLEAPILSWGLTPFLLGDVVKLALAALLLPALWRLVGRARK
ncbi:MAG: biotin transporter BioY [Rhodobacteraceae bacterium]|nr:biotin transporter BioY [Paracoccaceae bacterium]